MNLDILWFLLPSKEFLPWIFFSIIISLFSWTIVSIKKSATPVNWEKNWLNDEKKSARLDLEHSSVEDISATVETSAERWADAMPGMILIIGLLGTFLGLGLALDKASSILSNANSNSMDTSMTQLMGMMEGLGTKFKTSTWGLIAFIGLKIILSQDNYAVRRLNWCTNKIKDELFANRMQQKQIEKNERLEWIDIFKEAVENINTTNKHINQRNVDSLKTLADQLDCATHKNQEAFNTLFELEKSHSENQQKLLSHNYANLSQLLNSNIEESRSARIAMEKFVDNHAQTIGSLSKSAQDMSQAASIVGKSAGELQTVVEHLRNNMSEVMLSISDVIDNLKHELSETIHEMNQTFSKNMTIMQSNLSETIADMNNSFKKNMVEMSNNLDGATNNISNAVNSLSISVEHTMKNVTDTLNTSIDIQKKAQMKFVETSNELNTHIIQMTDLVDKLKGDITSGLNAVSESNRSMISLGKKYGGFSEQVQEVVGHMTDISDEIKGNTVNIKALFNMLNDSKSSSEVLKHLQSIQNLLIQLLEKQTGN